MLSGICRENQGDGTPPSVMDNPAGGFWNEKKSCQDVRHSPSRQRRGGHGPESFGDSWQEGQEAGRDETRVFCSPGPALTALRGPSRVLTPALALSTTRGLDTALGRRSVRKAKEAD